MFENVKLSRLIPVCLISLLMGQILPHLIPSKPLLTLAAAGYLLLIVALDLIFKQRA